MIELPSRVKSRQTTNHKNMFLPIFLGGALMVAAAYQFNDPTLPKLAWGFFVILVLVAITIEFY
jgi:uncharacterized membrane protein